MMGSERKSMILNEEQKKLTAYHEAGHAIVGLNLPEHSPVYKVTIIPRGRALGVTMFLPEEDVYTYSKTALISQITSLFGGRVAEEIINGKDGITTGASNDIERATDLARNMVTKWGFSDKLGTLKYDDEDENPFLGRSAGAKKEFSLRKPPNKLMMKSDQSFKHVMRRQDQFLPQILINYITWQMHY